MYPITNRVRLALMLSVVTTKALAECDASCPFHALRDMEKRFSEHYQTFFSGWRDAGTSESSQQLVQITEGQDALVVSIAVDTGTAADSIKITPKGRRLSVHIPTKNGALYLTVATDGEYVAVSCQQQQEIKEEKNAHSSHSYSQGSMRQVIQAHLNLEDATAELIGGKLVLTIPRTDKAKQIKVIDRSGAKPTEK